MTDRTALATVAAAVIDPENSLRSSEVSAESSAKLAATALRHGVGGSLALAMQANDVPLPDDLQSAVDHAQLVHLQTSRALRTLAPALARDAIPWAVIKGPALSRLWDRSAVTRTYSDLDILVRRQDMAQVIELLESHGFRGRNRNWSGFVDLGVAELPFDDGYTIVDLHWNVVALASQRRHLSFDTEAMLSRCSTAAICDLELPVLAPPDAFAHTSCHAGLAGARTLRQLRDVHLSAAAVSRPEAEQRLRSSGIHRMAAGVLSRAVRALGPVPNDPPVRHDAADSPQLSDLGHPLWVAAVRASDFAWAASRGDRAVTYPGGIVSSARDRLGPMVAALARAPVVNARARIGLPTIESDGGPLDWEKQDPTDSAAGLASYLEYLAGDRP